MKRFSPFFLVLLMSCESENNSTQLLESQKWVSKDRFRTEVWFQDWSNYTRLFIKTFKDTSEVFPSPYVTRTKNKPYLYPKPYMDFEVEQLIGNLEWDSQVSWEMVMKTCSHGKLTEVTLKNCYLSNIMVPLQLLMDG